MAGSAGALFLPLMSPLTTTAPPRSLETTTSSFRVPRRVKNQTVPTPARAMTTLTARIDFAIPRFLSASAARTDGLFLGADLAQEARLRRERRKLFPIADGHLLAADLVAQAVVRRERVGRELLQELHGREGAVVHLVLVDHVPRTRIALEARLEGTELRGRIVGRLPAGASLAVGSASGRPNGSPWPGPCPSSRLDVARVSVVSARWRRRRQHRESDVDIELRARVELPFVHVGWVNALARSNMVERASERAESAGRCARSPMMALPMSTSRASGSDGSSSRGRFMAAPIVLAGHHLVEDRAHREDARAGVTRLERALQLGRQAVLVGRLRRARRRREHPGAPGRPRLGQSRTDERRAARRGYGARSGR